MLTRFLVIISNLYTPVRRTPQYYFPQLHHSDIIATRHTHEV